MCVGMITLQNCTTMGGYVFTAQLAGKARQLGCPKIVLDHVRVYIHVYVCTLWISSLLVVYDAI